VSCELEKNGEKQNIGISQGVLGGIPWDQPHVHIIVICFKRPLEEKLTHWCTAEMGAA